MDPGKRGRRMRCGWSVMGAASQKTAAINGAQGEATAVQLIAEATASAVRTVAAAIGEKGGMDAANLKVAEIYVSAFSNLAKTNNTLIVPSNVSDVASMVTSAMTILTKTKAGTAPIA